MKLYNFYVFDQAINAAISIISLQIHATGLLSYTVISQSVKLTNKCKHEKIGDLRV